MILTRRAAMRLLAGTPPWLWQRKMHVRSEAEMCERFSLDFVPKKPVVFLNLVQQPMEYELPLLVFRNLEFTGTHLVGDQLAVPTLETMLPLVASAGSGVQSQALNVL